MPVIAPASGVPAGTVEYFAASSAPAGFIKANGAAVSRTTYAALFLAIGTTYGVGDGSTTFNVPDLRGEFVRGLDDGRGIDAGRNIGTAQAELIAGHTHDLAADNAPTTFFARQNGTGATGYWNGSLSTGAVSTGEFVKARSSANAETRPRNVALLACIKF